MLSFGFQPMHKLGGEVCSFVQHFCMVHFLKKDELAFNSLEHNLELVIITPWLWKACNPALIFCFWLQVVVHAENIWNVEDSWARDWFFEWNDAIWGSTNNGVDRTSKWMTSETGMLEQTLECSSTTTLLPFFLLCHALGWKNQQRCHLTMTLCHWEQVPLQQEKLVRCQMLRNEWSSASGCVCPWALELTHKLTSVQAFELPLPEEMSSLKTKSCERNDTLQHCLKCQSTLLSMLLRCSRWHWVVRTKFENGWKQFVTLAVWEKCFKGIVEESQPEEQEVQQKLAWGQWRCNASQTASSQNLPSPHPKFSVLPIFQCTGASACCFPTIQARSSKHRCWLTQCLFQLCSIQILQCVGKFCFQLQLTATTTDGGLATSLSNSLSICLFKRKKTHSFMLIMRRWLQQTKSVNTEHGKNQATKTPHTNLTKQGNTECQHHLSNHATSVCPHTVLFTIQNDMRLHQCGSVQLIIATDVFIQHHNWNCDKHRHRWKQCAAIPTCWNAQFVHGHIGVLPQKPMPSFQWNTNCRNLWILSQPTQHALAWAFLPWHVNMDALSLSSNSTSVRCAKVDQHFGSLLPSVVVRLPPSSPEKIRSNHMMSKDYNTREELQMPRGIVPTVNAAMIPNPTTATATTTVTTTGQYCYHHNHYQDSGYDLVLGQRRRRRRRRRRSKFDDRNSWPSILGNSAIAWFIILLTTKTIRTMTMMLNATKRRRRRWSRKF